VDGCWLDAELEWFEEHMSNSLLPAPARPVFSLACQASAPTVEEIVLRELRGARRDECFCGEESSVPDGDVAMLAFRAACLFASTCATRLPSYGVLVAAASGCVWNSEEGSPAGCEGTGAECLLIDGELAEWW
jgi:hypothetical protein